MRIRSRLFGFRHLAAAVLLLAAAGCESPEERTQSYYERGLKFADDGETVKASLEFRNALKLNSDFVPALYEIAKIEVQNRAFDRAARIFLRITEQDAEHVEARVELAKILLLAGRIDDSLKYADQAFALADGDPTVLVLKAGIALKLADREAAVRFARQALEREPENLDALMVLAAERLADNDPDGALSLIDSTTDENSANLGVQLFRMRALEAMGDSEGVEGVFLKLSELFPGDPSINIALAQWYLAQNRIDDAELAMRQYVNNNADNADAGLHLVNFLKTVRGFPAASKELNSLIASGRNSFTYQIALVELHLAQDEREAAVDLLKALIADANNAADRSTARVWLAQTLMSGADGDRVPEDARSLVQSVLNDDAGNIDALVLNARIAVAEGRLEAAIETLRTAAEEDPDSARIRLMLAEVFERNGASVLAQEQLAKAVQVERGEPRAHLAYAHFLIRYGKSDHAIRVLSESQPDRDVLSLLAQLRLRRGEWASAQEIAEQLRKLDQSGNTSDQIIAAALSGQSKFEESLSILEAAVSPENADTQPLASLVRTYVAAGQADRAAAFLDSVLESNPANVQARVLKGSVHLFSGEPEAAEAAYKEVIDIDEAGVAGHLALSALHFRNGSADEAEIVARQGLERQPSNAQLRLFLATILERAEKYDDAISEYEAMLAANPRSTIAANNLASLLSDHRKDQASLDRAFELAIRLKGSEIPQFVDTLGWIYYLRGDYGEAATLLKAAAEQLPDLAVVQYHLGMAYLGLERRDLARESLGNALALSADEDSPFVARIKVALSNIEKTENNNSTN